MIIKSGKVEPDEYGSWATRAAAGAGAAACEFIVERPCCWEGKCRPQTLWGPETIRIILGTSALLPEVVTYPLVPYSPPPEHSAEEETLGTCSSCTDR